MVFSPHRREWYSLAPRPTVVRREVRPDGKGGNPMSMIGAVTGASACVLSASVAGGYVWAKISRGGSEYNYRACPKCRQRLRFQVRKAGRPGQCPRCRHRFTLTADAFVKS